MLRRPAAMSSLRPCQRPYNTARRAGGGPDGRVQPGLSSRFFPDRPWLGRSTRPGSPRRQSTGAGIGWHDHVHDVHEGL